MVIWPHKKVQTLKYLGMMLDYTETSKLHEKLDNFVEKAT